MSERYVSLYFASIDARRAARLLGAWTTAPLARSNDRRRVLAQAVCEQIGPAHVFSYRSARGALAACLSALGVGRGDSVLLSSFTCLAVPTAVLAVGARPEYVDIDPLTLNTPAAAVIASMRSDVRAVVVQHTLGRGAEAAGVVAAARARGIAVIEDCALSVGSTHAGRPLGSHADAAIYSMELSKTISCGWGGVLAIRDVALANKVTAHYTALPEPPWLDTARRVAQTALSGVCYERSIFPAGRYIVAAGMKAGLFRPSTPACENDGRPAADFIARLSGTQAALAAAQWRRLPQVAAVSAANGCRLREALRYAGFQVLADPESGDVSVTPRVPFLVADRDAATRWFAANDIELGAWFDGPLSPLPDPHIFNYHPQRYPRAAVVARHIVNLASHCRLTDADIERIVEAIARYAASHPADRDIKLLRSNR